jgi:MATE family multidrug resistance protein
MMVASVALFLAAWALLEPAFGNHGLWAALTLLYVFRALTLLACLPALVRGAFG